MTSQEKGGRARKQQLTRICESCGQVIAPSREFARLGAKGGTKGGATTLKRYGREHMAAIGRKGGRPRMEEKCR